MNDPFVLEWLGGPAEHHYRKARPTADLDWTSLDPNAYPPELVAQARHVWMGIVISEYAAIACFAEVVAALTAARVPLDLIGMASDFLADEVHHVELASRVVMQLGGAPPRSVDTTRLAPRAASNVTPFERANELVLRVGCVSEVFAGGTAAPIMHETGHPLMRAVYERILRDEARHKRFGGLYFEWAANHLNPAECERLASAAVSALELYPPLWRAARTAGAPARYGSFEPSELGWLEGERYMALAERVVREDIVRPLGELGIVVPPEKIAALFEL
jgi:hypothetical protein